MASAENIYFIRAFLMLVEGGLYITRHILEREKGDGDLCKLLKSCENKLKHEFHGKQYKKLFPQYGNTNIYTWDLQLIVGVLLTVFGHTLTSREKQKLLALRDLRNEILLHCSSASLNQKKYEGVREEIVDIISSLAATFDEPVKTKCSGLLLQYATEHLDGKKLPMATLNGFNQACHKKFKVRFRASSEEPWVNLCEHILNAILNDADSVVSVDLKAIQRNVLKMLDFLQAHRSVLFKETGHVKEEIVNNSSEITPKEGIEETGNCKPSSGDKLCNMIKQSLKFEQECTTKETNHIASVTDTLSGHAARNDTLKVTKAIEESADLTLQELKENPHEVDEVPFVENKFTWDSETYASRVQPFSRPSDQSVTDDLRIKELKQNPDGDSFVEDEFTSENENCSSLEKPLSQPFNQKHAEGRECYKTKVRQKSDKSDKDDEEKYTSKADLTLQELKGNRHEVDEALFIDDEFPSDSKTYPSLVQPSSQPSIQSVTVDLRIKELKQNPHDVDEALCVEHEFSSDSETYASLAQPSSQPSIQFSTDDLRIKELKQNPEDVCGAPFVEDEFTSDSETYSSLEQPLSQPSNQTHAESTQKRVRLVKTYAWMKEVMELSKARSVADHLFQHEPRMLSNNYHEYIHSFQRRIEAVESLLKKVLLGPDGIYDVFLDSLDPEYDEYILRKLIEEQVTESDIKAFMVLERSAEDSVSIPTREEPLLMFTKKNRRYLEVYLHDKATIDSINDNFLSRFIFRIDEHTNIADTSLDVKRKLKRLLSTMNLCSKSISKDFFEILELESVGMSHVVNLLDGQEKRRSSSVIDEDIQPTSKKSRQMHHLLSPNKQSDIVLSLNQPDSNMRNKDLDLGCSFDHAEEGSIIIQLTPSRPESWKILEKNCHDGTIKDFIPEVFKDNGSDMEVGEYWLSFIIYILLIPPYYEGSKKIMFYLDNEQSPFTEGTLKLLCEELEVTKRLLSLLKKEGIVNESQIREIAKKPRRQKVQRVLDEIKPHGHIGYNILKEYTRKENEYLYNEIVTSEGANELSDTMRKGTNVTPRPARASRENRKQIFYQASVLLVVKKTDRKKRKENCCEDVEISCQKIVSHVCNFPEEVGKKGQENCSADIENSQGIISPVCRLPKEEPQDGKVGKRKEFADGDKTLTEKQIPRKQSDVLIVTETIEEATGPIQHPDGLDGKRMKCADKSEASKAKHISKTTLDVSIDTENIKKTSGPIRISKSEKDQAEL